MISAKIKAYIALGSLVGMLILSFFVYNFGYDNAFNESEARQKIAVEAALENYKGKVKRAVEAAGNYEQDKIKLENYNGKLEERIQAYIDKSNNPDVNCLDDDGVQLFNSIGSGRESSNTSQLKRTLQKGFTKISRWQPKFYNHQPKRYLLPVRELS